MRKPKETGLAPIACSVQEAIRLSGLGRSEMYAALGDGRIEARKFGSRTLVLVESLRRFLGDLPVYDRTPPANARAMIERAKRGRFRKGGAS